MSVGSRHARGSRLRPPGLALLLAVAGAAGCGGAAEDPDGLACDRDPPLTYENFGAGALDRQCNSCHSAWSREGQRVGAPLGVDFDTWEDVLTWADRIAIRAVEDETMPPAGGMDDTERARLGEWLACEVAPAVDAAAGEGGGS